MKVLLLALSVALVFFCPAAKADSTGSSTNVVTPATPPSAKNATRVATLAVSDLREYATLAAPVQQLLANALKLTTLDLSYNYGSSDPSTGGMDCSGTVWYLLQAAGLKDVPRDASGMYKWVWMRSRFEAVTSSNPDTFELAPLRPGDLLFWTGTYAMDHDPPVTHVMIYLGLNRLTGRRVMVGASEGRRFNGQSMYGVSVFDFTLPGAKHSGGTESRFIGYGAIPGLESVAPLKAP
jgi:cell wall-associated NlpC family hydrolase